MSWQWVITLLTVTAGRPNLVLHHPLPSNRSLNWQKVRKRRSCEYFSLHYHINVGTLRNELWVDLFWKLRRCATERSSVQIRKIQQSRQEERKRRGGTNVCVFDQNISIYRSDSVCGLVHNKTLFCPFRQRFDPEFAAVSTSAWHYLPFNCITYSFFSCDFSGKVQTASGTRLSLPWEQGFSSVLWSPERDECRPAYASAITSHQTQTPEDIPSVPTMWLIV